MKVRFRRSVLSLLLAISSTGVFAAEPQLLRVSYHSAVTNADRDYFVYLPRNFAQQDRWPVMLFLHGNGERGDGKQELDYVLKHGPLFEAWCQRRDLPFVIISPQLPMFDQGEIAYIKGRTRASIPERRADGQLNSYNGMARSKEPLNGQLSERPPPDRLDPGAIQNGWNMLETELLAMIDQGLTNYKGDVHRVYLVGLSRGAVGTWYLAAKHPGRFAAIAPVVGYGVPVQAASIARAKVPLWVFAAGRDATVPLKYFYPVLNELEKEGHPEVRFTIEADLGHDAWMRVFQGSDLYNWLLGHSK